MKKKDVWNWAYRRKEPEGEWSLWLKVLVALGIMVFIVVAIANNMPQ